MLRFTANYGNAYILQDTIPHRKMQLGLLLNLIRRQDSGSSLVGLFELNLLQLFWKRVKLSSKKAEYVYTSSCRLTDWVSLPSLAYGGALLPNLRLFGGKTLDR